MVKDILDQIAQEVEEITEQQDKNEVSSNKEDKKHFEPENYRRDMDDYDGGW